MFRFIVVWGWVALNIGGIVSFVATPLVGIPAAFFLGMVVAILGHDGAPQLHTAMVPCLGYALGCALGCSPHFSWTGWHPVGAWAAGAAGAAFVLYWIGHACALMAIRRLRAPGI